MWDSAEFVSAGQRVIHDKFKLTFGWNFQMHKYISGS